MEIQNRCYRCMNLKPEKLNTCPSCGYKEDTPYDPNYAPPGTELNGKYIIGVKIGHNSEGANYIGYNSSIGCKVLIREYCPAGLCKRVRGRAAINVQPNRVIPYKTLKEEFKELNRKLAQMRNLQHIIPTLDIIDANNTTYVIYEYLEGIKLVEYLKDHAGELTWQQVSELFPSFFTTLSLMHNNGVIHRAISPDTIYVTPKTELRLCGFSIYDVRTMNLELPSEIFQGYAAPEQYTPGAQQGSFTDVYGICAVLYRLLTGCQPVDAPSRLQQDNLSPPYELNQNIPKNVSEAVMKGMCLDSQQRTQTITELVTQLFEQTEEPQEPESERVISVPEKQKKKKENKKENQNRDSIDMEDTGTGQESIIEKYRMPLITAVMTICILLILAIIIIGLMNRSGTVSVNSSTETTTVAEETVTENNIVTESSGEAEPGTELQGDSQMPLLVGMRYEIKKEQLETDGWLYLEPSYQYSDDYEAGLIIWQSIEAGQPFNSGAVVKVIVSQGPSSVQIPEYAGKTLMEYEEELDALGMSGRYTTEAVVNYSFETGYIVEMNKQAGEIFNLSGEETLKIFYASNPETTPATEPPQTTVAPTEQPVSEIVVESSTDNSGVQLETAPSVAPEGNETENDSERTEEAPETAPGLEDSEPEIPDYETAPPVPDEEE